MNVSDQATADFDSGKVSATVTTCDRLGGPDTALGYETLACVLNDDTMGCTCAGGVNQEGAPGLVSLRPETSGSYTLMDNSLVLEDDVTYSYCVTETTMVLTVETVGPTGTVMGPIVLQKQ
jgi:hypothetical protein